MGITGRFIRWEHPKATDASTMTGEQIKVTQSVYNNDRNHIATPEPHISEYFFPIRFTFVKYLFEDWAGNEATCKVVVEIQEGKKYNI